MWSSAHIRCWNRTAAGLIAVLLTLLMLVRQVHNMPVAAAQNALMANNEETIRGLIRQLGDDKFQTRQAAERKLRDFGASALPLLRRATQADSLEVRRRVEALIRSISKTVFYQVATWKGHQGQGAYLWSARLVPTADGKTLLTCGGDAVRIWNIADGTQRQVIDPGVKGRWSIALSKDGQRAIVGYSDGKAQVWELASGKEVQRLAGHSGEIWGVALPDDGRLAITGSWDRSLRLWDVASGKEVRRFGASDDKIRAVALSPNGRHLAAAHFLEDQPAVLRIYEVPEGAHVRTCKGHEREISSVAFSPDGVRLLTAGFDKTVRLWDFETAKELRRFQGHISRVECAAFWPDGRHAISCGDEDDRTIRLWDLSNGDELLCVEPQDAGLLSIAPFPDGRRCATTGKDGLVRIWEWKQDREHKAAVEKK